MNSSRIQSSFIVHTILLVALIFTISPNSNINADLETYGVVSSNLADRPPLMNPDVSARSTDPNRPPAYGPEDAKVLVVVFSDFQCPHCRRASQAVHQIAAEFPNEVRIEVYQHAQPEHRSAEIAAAAALAAQRQGYYWEMYDKILQDQSSINATKLEQYAQELNLDMHQFTSDMNDPEIRERIQKESELAVDLGAKGTPGFLINAKLHVGWGSWKYFRSLVEKELVTADELQAQGMISSKIQRQRAIDNSDNSESFELYRVNILEEDA